jgi:hypothetical protein
LDVSDPTHREDLRRYWDDLVVGQPPRPDSVDPGLANLIQWLHGQRDNVQPDAAYANRLREDLMHQLPSGRVSRLAAFFDTASNLKSRRPKSRWSDSEPRSTVGERWRGRFALVSAALLLLVILGLGYVIFAHLLPSTGNDNRNIVPAAFAPEATPMPGIGGVPLFDVTVPEDQFPHGGNRGAVLLPVTIGAGAVGQWTSDEGASDPGVRLVYVLSGSLAVRTGGAGDPGQLVTRGGNSEVIPTGGELELKPGDAWITRLETEFNFDNTGNQPVELIVWVLTDQPMLFLPMPAGWEHPHMYTGDAISPEPGPATLQMFLVPLAAGDAVPSPQEGEYHFSAMLPFNAAGTPITSDIALTHDDGIQNVGKQPIQIYVLAMIPEDAPASGLETEIRQP